MRIGIPAILLILALAPAAHAQAPPVGPVVLRLPATPRSAALGNAWVAGRDQEVLFYNPAQLIGARQGMDLSITRHGCSGTATTLGSVYSGGKWSTTLGWGVQFVDFSVSPSTPYPYAPDVLLSSGSADASSVLVSVGGAFIYKGFRIGAAGKYVVDRVSIPSGSDSVLHDPLPQTGSAMLADIGVAKSLFGGMAALSVQNLGRDSLDGVTPNSIPRQVLMGWSIGRSVRMVDMALYTQVTLRDGWTSAGAGYELGYSWIEGYNVAFRVGVRRPETTTETPVTLGAAFTADRLTLEYGVQFFEGGHAANGVTIRWR